MLATIDLEGWVIIRDLTRPDESILKLRPEFEEYTAIEFANVCLNNHHQLLNGQLGNEDLFITLNNQLFVYSLTNQALLANPIYNANILKIRQERGLLLMAMDDDSIQCYDYQRQQNVSVIHGVTENSGELLCMHTVDFVGTQ